MIARAIALLALPAYLLAQTVCQPAVQYSPCESLFAGPVSVEFRSPRQESALKSKLSTMAAAKWIVRFTPNEAGQYAYRVDGGKEGQFNVSGVDKPGVLRAANVHHFALVDGNKLTPHLSGWV